MKSFRFLLLSLVFITALSSCSDRSQLFNRLEDRTWFISQYTRYSYTGSGNLIQETRIFDYGSFSFESGGLGWYLFNETGRFYEGEFVWAINGSDEIYMVLGNDVTYYDVLTSNQGYQEWVATYSYEDGSYDEVYMDLVRD